MCYVTLICSHQDTQLLRLSVLPGQSEIHCQTPKWTKKCVLSVAFIKLGYNVLGCIFPLREPWSACF